MAPSMDSRMILVMAIRSPKLPKSTISTFFSTLHATRYQFSIVASSWRLNPRGSALSTFQQERKIVRNTWKKGKKQKSKSKINDCKNI